MLREPESELVGTDTFPTAVAGLLSKTQKLKQLLQVEGSHVLPDDHTLVLAVLGYLALSARCERWIRDDLNPVDDKAENVVDPATRLLR